MAKKSVAKIIYLNGGEENLVVLNEGGYQVSNEDGSAHVPKKENRLAYISVILHAVFYLLSTAFLLLFVIAPGISWIVSANLLVLALSLILPTPIAFLSLFEYKNEPGKYADKWIPIYVIANKLFVLAVLAGASFAIRASFFQPFIVIPLLVLVTALFIYALLPKKKAVSAK
jgi:hypothetical protein